MTRYEAYKRLNRAIDRIMEVAIHMPSGNDATTPILDAIRDIDDVRVEIGRTAQPLEVQPCKS